MTEEEDIALIDRFIEGRLSDAEAESVKKRIENDKEFASLYNDMKYLIGSTRVVGRRELIDFLKKEDAKTSGTSVQWYVVSGIAAAIALVAAFFIFRDTGNPLVDEYFAPYPNTVVPVIRGTPTDSSLRAAALAQYELGNYAAALESLEQIAPSNPDDLFYMGISALGLKDYSLAVTYLKDYESKGESFVTQTKWYLALAYLGADNVEQSRSYLNALAAEDGSYKQQAAELLSKIDRDLK
ncbi:MAG TPA: hypothetical protein VFE50_01060 [Cyclobacteriaceae bacterium]|nr:hypothetical protein [Cyclobacteriaceae bacterium]